MPSTGQGTDVISAGTLGGHRDNEDVHHDKDHASRHASGGADEIDVTGLTPKTHGAAQHTDVQRELFIFPGNSQGAILGDYPTGYTLADNVVKRTYFTFKVPDDFVSLVHVHAVIEFAAAGDMNYSMLMTAGADGEAHDTHTASTLNQVFTSPGAGKIGEVTDASAIFSDIAAGDYVGVDFRRNGDSGGDTMNDSVVIYGLLIQYTAEQ